MLLFRTAVIVMLATLALTYVTRAEHDHMYLHHLEHRMDAQAARLDALFGYAAASPWHAPPGAPRMHAAMPIARPVRPHVPAAPPAPSPVLVDIERSSFQRLLDPAGPHSYARLMPAHYHGPPVGYRLYGVHPGSLFAVLGLQNGDLVRSINGAPLASPQSILEPGALDTASARDFIDIELERHGTPMRIVVLIHPHQG